MAKAALEAINGCNLFGEKGASWSVVFVDIDAHNRNRSIFETLLPRESSSKVRFKIPGIWTGGGGFLFKDFTIPVFFHCSTYIPGIVYFHTFFVNCSLSFHNKKYAKLIFLSSAPLVFSNGKRRFVRGHGVEKTL